MSKAIITQRSIHDEIGELMPLLLSNSLNEIEQNKIHAHLNACVICRREFAFVDCLRAEFHALEIPRFAGPAGPQRLRSRLDTDRPETPRTPRSGHSFAPAPQAGTKTRMRRLRTMIVAAVSGMMLAASVIIVALLVPHPFSMRPVYHTLASVPAAPTLQMADLEVVFRSQIPRGQRDSILKALGVAVIAGPSSDGRYGLRLNQATVKAGDVAVIVRRLRQFPEVAHADVTRAVSTPTAVPSTVNNQ